LCEKEHYILLFFAKSLHFGVERESGLFCGEAVVEFGKFKHLKIKMNTVAELPSYISFAEKHLSTEERQDIINFLAKNPKAGDIMQGTGSVRKLRWGKGGRGKSGGVRVIYYFYNEQLPLYLVTLFAKNERDNLTAEERNNLAKLVAVLVTTALEKKK